MKKILLPFIFAFIGIATMHTAKAQTYDPHAVQVINNLIANNGLQATPDAPETWGDFAFWNDETPKQILWLHLEKRNLFGNVLFAELTALRGLFLDNNAITKIDITGCPQLTSLYCTFNLLTELDLTNCTQLKRLKCEYNKLTKINLTNCTQLLSLSCDNNDLTELDLTDCTQLEFLYCAMNKLTKLDATYCTQLKSGVACHYNELTELYVPNMRSLSCYDNKLTELDLSRVTDLSIESFYAHNQNVSLTLYQNEANTYTHSIILNAPAFGNTAIGYANGVLESTNNAVHQTSFTVQTGKSGFELSGTMDFSYVTVGINEQNKNKAPLKVYPNPANDILFVECEEFSTIKMYDMMGKEILSQQGNGKTAVNINHLPKGVYIINVFSERKVMGNTKVVKL